MIQLLMPLTMLLFISCMDAPKKQQAANKASATESQGRFKIILEDENYEVAILCKQFSSEFFTFSSDSNGANDTNSDGIIINGSQHGDALAISVMISIDGQMLQYSTTPTTKTFTKEAGRLSGQARFAKGLDNKHLLENIGFKLICNE